MPYLAVRTQYIPRHLYVVPVLLHRLSHKLVKINKLISHMESVKIGCCYVSVTKHHTVIVIRSVTISYPLFVAFEVLLKQFETSVCLPIKIIKRPYILDLKIILFISSADKITDSTQLSQFSVEIARHFIIFTASLILIEFPAGFMKLCQIDDCLLQIPDIGCTAFPPLKIFPTYKWIAIPVTCHKLLIAVRNHPVYIAESLFVYTILELFLLQKSLVRSIQSRHLTYALVRHQNDSTSASAYPLHLHVICLIHFTHFFSQMKTPSYNLYSFSIISLLNNCMRGY